MPIASITSTKTGQTFDVDFTDQPTADDIDEVTSAWDTQFYQREGLDPSIAEQGVVGTAGNAFARDLGGTALDAVGGVAKGTAEMSRALGPMGNVLRFVPGVSTVMSLGDAGDAVAGFTDAVREESRAVYPVNPANPVAETIGGGAGQAVAMLGTMGAAAPVLGTGAALTVVPTVLSGAMGVGSGIDTAKELGIDNPAGRLALGAAFGGAEALTERLGGIGGTAAAEALQTGVKAGLKQAGKSVLSEAIEEPISGTLQDAATFTAGQFVADPKRPGYTVTGMKLPALDAEFMNRRKLEAIGGAAGGTVFAGLQLAASGKPAPATPTTPSPMPVSEDLGELTAEDVADLEPEGVGQTVSQPGQAVSQRAPILGNVPDALMQPAPVNTPTVVPEFNEPANIEQPVPAPINAANAFAKADAEADAANDTVATVAPAVEGSGQTMADLPDGATTPKFTLPPGSQIASDVYRSEGDIQITGEPVWDTDQQAWLYPAVTQGGRGFRVAERFINKVVSQPGRTVSQPSQTNVSVTKGSERAAADQTGEQAIGAGSSPATGASDLATPTTAGTVPDARVPAAAETSGMAGVQPARTTGFKNLEPGGKTAGFVNGQILAEAETLIRDGITDFANWSRAMVTRFGQAIRQYLQGIWEQVVAALPNDAAKNVRLGRPAGGPVRLSASGALDVGPTAGKGVLGTVADGEVITVKVPNLEQASHANIREIASAGQEDGAKDFRYNPVTQTVYWGRLSSVSETERQKVADYLKAEGYTVKGHKATSGNDANYREAHGLPGKAPVKLAQGGFVAGPGKMKETQSRFASPDEQERLYQVREDVTVKAAAEAWVDSMPMEQAVAAMEAGRLPADMTGDVAQHAAGLLIQRTTEMMKSGSEVVQMQARSLGHRISKVWQGWLSQEAGRNLRQRSVVNSELTPYAPILAAEGMLIDRADAVMDKRYEGGATGGATKVNETADKAGGEASTELAADLESAEVQPGESEVARQLREARKLRAMKKHPSLKRMLDALRKKLYPGMKWADIFMDLPSTQKERQREIYRRLMLDERLKGLTKDERLALTNELDKAWQQERRKVFLRELERVGIGEKAAADKAKVVKALPKLIRLINLGMMNSEMFREAIAPEYGLKQITTQQALALRKLAEEAYALPEGVLRSRKLAALLDGIQKSTGTGLPEVLNQYWVAAVLSGMRTQFDTFMSVSNGFGNQLIQSGMLALKNGNRAAAVVSMMEWWRGLKQAFPEAMQILAKGDYSYLKRFNEDLKKALEGESTFRPVPLGEALWRDGNAMEKYGFAPVMIWTGRLMAAADHLNNSATTAGAKVVARALHPELYKTVAASQSERDAAAAQARREVTGGAMPATAAERATVAARTREILNGQLRPEELKEASFMGDQAAYQNDPTGAFGGIYRAVNQGLGSLERGLQAYADEKSADGPAGRYARGLMLFLSGAMRSMMGAKFIRFGANFGNDMLGYVPGTVLLSPALLGTEATRSQRQLLMGKNVFSLMAGLTVAAMFLGKDDEEEGWHMEGPWTDLTPEEAKQRRAAGFEPLTFWKRTPDKVQRVSYKQWPTAGLLAGVAHMQDRQRFRPEKWAAEGMAGHLLAAASVGAFQVKDVSAMRGLADLLGASKFGTNPEDAFVEKMAKMPINFAGGFIPTLAKDLDALADPRRYKPATVLEEFLRNVPVLRQRVAGGRPEINILGVAVEQDRKPWSRAYTDAESGPAHAVLGSLSARGFTLPTPETNRKVWKAGAWTTIAAMGADAEWRYQKKVGDGYRAWLGSPEGYALLTNPDGLAVQRLINRQAEAIKMRAVAEMVK